MRKIYILMIVFATSFLSCSDEQQEEQSTPKTYTVSLGMKGEVLDIIQTPLTKSGENNDLYGIQVYSTNTPDNENSYSPYAYGLFNNMNEATITLLDGYSYKFECTMVVDGKGKMYSENNEYGRPFGFLNSPYNIPLKNKFDTDVKVKMWFLADGGTSLIGYNYYIYPNIDRYYGVISDFHPTENSTVNIEMKRTVFGVKFIAEGLTEGKLKIAINGAPELYINNTDAKHEIEDVFTLNHVGDAFNTYNYSEDVLTSIYWIKTDGTEVPIAVNYTLTFTRKMMHTVKINLGGTPTKGGTPISITLEDGELGTGKDYTIGSNN